MSDLSDESLKFQAEMLKVQTETLKKAQSEMGLKTETLRYKASWLIFWTATIGLTIAITNHFNAKENLELKERISKLESKQK